MKVENIPISIRPYLLEIAERLWTGHASIMVGSGFSKNAINKADHRKGMPNWNELGDIFYEKIHGQKPENHSKYLNALKLADEVQAAFGRSVLDQILKQHIPDKDFEPSDTHVKLLELPWSDVFTTNYDTLLERSCENVISRRYDIVINQNDLVYSNRPRIVKLHGSFPSERPLIITEEDYRVYPKRFAPFVNTVQQSLLENTLCLIGFSGDDPNFLQWIGWINDNIGKDNSPKIYLLGILNLSEAQKKLLATKNIVPIDLGAFPHINRDHKIAIDIVLEFLSNQRQTRENLEWPLNQNFHNSDPFDVEIVLSDWKLTRLAYPNWIICPQENRDSLWTYTSQLKVTDEIFNDLNSPQDIDFIYELNWRFEKCLFPLYNDYVSGFEQIMSQYNPFPSLLNSKAKNQPTNEDTNINWSDIRSKWIHLTLALLRFYREEGFHDKWLLNNNTLELINAYLSPEQTAWFYHEKVLKAIFDSNIELAKKTLHEWPGNEFDPFWDARRATLLAEFGYIEESYKILENALTTVRKRLNLTPVGNDYKWVSEEAYLMFLLRLIKQNIRLSKRIFDIDDQSQDFNERWNSLLQFKCAPWQEKKYFDLILQYKYESKASRQDKESFEIGVTSSSYTLGRTDNQLIVAYTFLRYIEEIGIPLSLSYMNIDNKTLKGAIERLEPYSPQWVYAIYKRSRDKDLADVIFSRSGLSKLNESSVDNLIIKLLETYKLLSLEENQTIIASSFISKVPITLSRLCVKCSEQVRLKVFEFYAEACKKDNPNIPLSKLWNTLLASSGDRGRTAAIPLLLGTPVLNNSLARAQFDFPEPFQHFKVKLSEQITISRSVITDLLRKASDIGNTRNRAISRLLFLFEHDLLTVKEKGKFQKVLWGHLDQNGFPDDTNYYYFAFLETKRFNLDVNVYGIFKKYIISNTFNIQGRKEGGISMTHGKDRYAAELWYGSANVNDADGIKWTSQEMDDIIDKCVNWWVSDNYFLIDDRYRHDRFGGSIYEEFLSRFKLLTNIICRVFGFQRSALTGSSILKIIELINDMEAKALPVLKAKIAFADVLNYSEKAFINELTSKMTSSEPHDVIDALEAAAIGLFYFENHINKSFIPLILDTLVQPLIWRNSELTIECLSIIDNILEHKPDCYKHIKTVILNCLEYLSLHTDISKHDGQQTEPIQHLLLLRQKAMSLASTIFAIEQDNTSIEIHHWQYLAESSNEFGEIKRKWKHN